MTDNNQIWENLDQQARGLNLTKEHWRAIRLIVNGTIDKDSVINLINSLHQVNSSGVGVYGYLVKKEREAIVGRAYDLAQPPADD